MRVINLTPHEVILVGDDWELGLPAAETPARVAVATRCLRRVTLGEGYSVPINRVELGQVEGLPEPRDSVLLIVSRVVAEAARDRGDLVIPDQTVRDEQSRIIGCRALASVANWEAMFATFVAKGAQFQSSPGHETGRAGVLSGAR